MKPCTIYCRVSTTRQAIDGISLDAQEARLRAWAAAHDSKVLGCHVDAGLSGSKASNRPALQAALDQACQEQAVLLVYSLSRLARSTKDAILIAERLDKASADLVSLSENIDTTSACGRMIFRLLAVLAEFERDLVSERTKLALRFKRANGQKTGGSVPYGYRAEGGQLVPEPHEQAGIRLALKLRRQGHTLKGIAERLHSGGYTPKLKTCKAIERILGREELSLRTK